MRAEVLRRAASLMRERVQAVLDADPEPDWYRTDSKLFVSWVGEQDAEHIASWHPAVALAVADWLEDEAETWASYGDDDNDGIPFYRAYLVATAYLGEDD